MCFLSTTEGLTAITIQSFTTAHTLGVLDQLQAHLKDYSSKAGELAAKGLVRMPPTAYRWVDEMDEIAKTSHTEGGFERHVFNRMGEVSRVVAHETDQGNEKTEDRRVGKTPGDVTKLMRQGLGEEQGESRVDRLRHSGKERSIHQPMSEILTVNITQSSNDSCAPVISSPFNICFCTTQ